MAINEIVVCQVPDFNRPDMPDILRQIKESGATSVQIYTFWRDFEPDAEGAFEWDYFDRQVRMIKDAGLKWVPFILMGPKYAAPTWWLSDPRHVGLVCLEHGKTSPIDSIWSEGIRCQVDRVLRAFAEHYLPWDVLESVQPGICGDYGESIMPVHGNWAGDYHTHAGFWCGGEDAAVSFRAAMERKYGAVGALNKAWNSHYAGFGEIKPFLPHRATSRTALFDDLEWYKDSMTEFVDFWLATCRKYFHDTPLYMCVGGNEEPEHASDFAAQAKVCAKYNAGLRLTNECNRFFDNFFLTSYTHSACEFYGACLGLEPVGPLTPEGVGARMFGSAVYGNRQIMYYYGNIYKTPSGEDESIYDKRTEAFMRYLPFLTERRTDCDAAFFWPGRVGALGHGIPDGIGPIVTYIRRITTIMPVNERMILDGALDRYKLLIVPINGFTDRAVLLRIADYVKAGGVVFAIGRMVDSELVPVPEYDELFGITSDSDIGSGGAHYRITDAGRFPKLAELGAYSAYMGWIGLSPETIRIAHSDFVPNAYSGTTIAAMDSMFMREYPAPNGKTGAAIAYFGPLEFGYDPQMLGAQRPVFPTVLREIVTKYTASKALDTQPGEQARGYIGDDLYVLYDDGRIERA